MKKTLLTLLTVSAVALPIVTVLSCGKPETNGHIEPKQKQELPKNPVTGNHQTPTIPKTVKEGDPWSMITDNSIDTKDAWTKIADNAIDPRTPWPSISDNAIDKRVSWSSVVDNAIDPRVSWTTQTKPIITNVKDTYDTTDKGLTTFNITTKMENPEVKGFLERVTSAPREFRIYDNGLFKVKIETTLIGPGKYYLNNDMADLQASDIAASISIGPAITHLPKGIQIMNSVEPASLGGPEGVQIALTNKYGNADDKGIKNTTALATHEYGHHETMYDFSVGLDGTLADSSTTGHKTMSEVMIKGLKDIGYESVSKLLASSDPTNRHNLTFMDAKDEDFPTDYGNISAKGHHIFNNSDYPFDAPEIATRMLNMLSFRTDLSVDDLYTPGGSGKYPNAQPKPVGFEPPPVFISDATMRHFAKDSTFGAGKDNSRIPGLIKFYEDEMFGLHQGSITLLGNPNGHSEVSGIKLNAFGMLPNLYTLEVQNSLGQVVGSSPVTRFNSRMGFKDELISNHWSQRLTESVVQIDSFKLNLTDVSTDWYKVVGKDVNGNVVDISKLRVGTLQPDDGDGEYPNNFGISPEGDHFYMNLA